MTSPFETTTNDPDEDTDANPATCQHEWAWNEILGDVCWLCLTKIVASLNTTEKLFGSTDRSLNVASEPQRKGDSDAN
jgi:hypothetical protein